MQSIKCTVHLIISPACLSRKGGRFGHVTGFLWTLGLPMMLVFLRCAPGNGEAEGLVSGGGA